MFLGVIPMICFEFLRILEKKNHKKGKTRKTGHQRPLRRGEVEEPERPPLGFAKV